MVQLAVATLVASCNREDPLVATEEIPVVVGLLVATSVRQPFCTEDTVAAEMASRIVAVCAAANVVGTC